MEKLTRPLTKQERDALASYERKCAVVRDKVRATVNGTKLGQLINGEGGIGKSHQVETTLREMNVKYILTNSHISTRGLVDLIQKYPAAIHLMEDIETIFQEKSAFGFLRSALWGQKDIEGEMKRSACWILHDKEIRIPFTGKIIVTANCPLDDLPELRAVATRIPPYRFRASKDELLAMMKKICNAGYRLKVGDNITRLTPEQCFEVFDYYLGTPEKKHHDLRILEHGFMDRIDALNNVLKETTWQDQFFADILKGEDAPVTRKVRIRSEREIALQLYGLYEEKKITHAEMHRRLGGTDRSCFG